MKPANPRILTINVSSSTSIKFALFEAGDLLRRNHTRAVSALMDWIEERSGQPGYDPRHSHGRRKHDSQDSLPRPRTWLQKGGLNHEDKNSFPGTAP
jgi:hypothetical protein